MRAALFCLTALAFAAEPNRLTDAEKQQGWRLLFDWRTTAGWVEVTGKPFPTNCWTVDNGALKALVRTDGFQDIRTTDSFRFFELEFDWKIQRGGNSGLKYLIEKVDEWTNTAGRQARARGLEYQLADEENPDAASDPRRAAASLYSVIAPVPSIQPKTGEFNQSRLVVGPKRIEHWLNGVKVVEFDTPRVQTSPLSLQNHSSETWFRSIRIRALPAE
jgi:hypothetical protein